MIYFACGIFFNNADDFIMERLSSCIIKRCIAPAMENTCAFFHYFIGVFSC